MKSSLSAKTWHRLVACATALLLCSPITQAQTESTDRANGARQGQQATSRKMRLIKKTTIKRADLPAGKLNKFGKGSPRSVGTSMSAVEGGCQPDSDSQENCGGDDEFQVFQYSFSFDSILNAPGMNDLARVEILQRVEVTGQRTIYVTAETDWGEVQLMFEALDNLSFKSIGIGESDAADIKVEAEQIRKDPKNLGKVIANEPKPVSLTIRGIEILTKKFPNALHRDKAVIEFNGGKCVEYERYDPLETRPNDWMVTNANASCD